MFRKTFEVQEFKKEINRLLSLNTVNKDSKITLCTLLERILMNTKNYKGFGYPILFTPECTQWKKDNPNKEYYEYVAENDHEYFREYN